MRKYVMSNEEKKFLKSYDITKFNRPSLTADIAVFAILKGEESNEYRKDPEQKLGVLLIKRGDFPYKDYWALPGGFAQQGEELRDTALRELREETGVDSAFIEPFGLFSAAERDPRGWIVSQGFLALVDSEKCNVSAGTDAGDAAWFTIDVVRSEMKKHVKAKTAEINTRYELIFENKDLGEKIEAVVEETKTYNDHHEKIEYEIIEGGRLAFDHAEIITRAFKSLHESADDAGKIIFDLMPEKFTLYSLQEAYEIVLGEKLTTPNFRRKIAPFVIETTEMMSGAGHRPAKLFKRNLEAFYG